MKPYLPTMHAIVTCMAVSGCFQHSDPQPLTHGWDILERNPSDAEPVSSKALLIADNQIHHLYGDPFLQRSVFIDKYFSGVAIRPPQLDLFGPELLRWALQSAQAMPVIHLGDALDLACVAEFDAFEQAMSGSGRAWVMTPGNHDAYFFGNFEDIEHFWQLACRRGGGPLRKDALITRYIQSLGKQWPSLGKQLRNAPEHGAWTCDRAVEHHCFLQAIQWHIDPVSRWRSYVLQKIDLSLPGSTEVFSVILIDSSQYPETPRVLFLHAGEEGSFLRDQAEVLRQWLDRATARGERLILATHHPYETLSRTSQEYLDALIRTYPVMLFLSAHTHAGSYSTHQSKGRIWLELNVGSILDWPVEYRTLAFRRLQNSHGSPGARIVLASELIRLPDQWEEDLEADVPHCDPAWEAKPGEPDYYLDYRTLSTLDYVTTQRKIYDNLLAAYERMLRVLPASSTAVSSAGAYEHGSEMAQRIHEAMTTTSLDTKRETLLWLRDAESRGDKPVHEHYRLCQARWASKYEDRRARVPHVQDEYIIMPSSEQK